MMNRSRRPAVFARLLRRHLRDAAAGRGLFADPLGVACSAAAETESAGDSAGVVRSKFAGSRRQIWCCAVTVLFVGFAGFAEASAQQMSNRVRIRSAEVGDSIGYAERGELVVEIHAAPNTVLFLPDTLSPSAQMASVGQGSWTSRIADGDSLIVEAVYPVMAFRAGIQQLPTLIVGVAERAAGGDAARIRDIADRSLLSMVELPLGSAIVTEFHEMNDSSARRPREPADVVGGEWSVWLILAFGLMVAAGAGGLGVVAPRWLRRPKASRAAVLKPFTRADALREMDRIRPSGSPPSPDDFYATMIGILRRFAAHLDDDWTVALTTRELLEHFRERFGNRTGSGLADAFDTGEKAKFAARLPADIQAESDWTAIRKWIEGSR